MIGMPEGVRKLLVAYDVEGYGGRGKRLELATQQRLVEVLTYAFGEAKVPSGGYEMQEQGDGGLALLPTGNGVDEPRVITSLIDALEAGLEQINEDLVAKARIRLRVGIDEGVVHRAAHGFAGPAVTGVCRLRDAPVVKETLKGSRGDLVVVVADHLYRDVLAHALGRKFAQVSATVKEFTAVAWIYLSVPTAPGPMSATAAKSASSAPHRPDLSERSEVPRLEDALKIDPGLW
jgi:hypothetical protein